MIEKMDKEKEAIKRIKLASEMSLEHYGKPLICAYSGGKDSDVILELFKRSGVPFETINSHTTADAPQTVRHIRRKFKKLEEDGYSCRIEYPKHNGKPVSMWTLIPMKLMPPTRIVRYCCAILKEEVGRNRFLATGVRRGESTARSSRGEIEKIGKTKSSVRGYSIERLMEDGGAQREVTEACMKKHKMMVNPIIDWTNWDVWDYINAEKIETCDLYKCGYSRVGCIGCPMAGRNRWKEFTDFPKYKTMYLHAFERMLKEIERRGLESKRKTAEEVFRWWMEDQSIEGQMSLWEEEA